MVISAWLTGIYFVIEMGIGLWTGSIAVISETLYHLAYYAGWQNAQEAAQDLKAMGESAMSAAKTSAEQAFDPNRTN